MSDDRLGLTGQHLTELIDALETTRGDTFPKAPVVAILRDMAAAIESQDRLLWGVQTKEKDSELGYRGRGW